MAKNADWRLTDQHTYLHEATLRWARFGIRTPLWDHDYCVFCGQVFTDKDTAGIEREGYTAYDDSDGQDAYYWVCARCYGDFKDMFQWKVVDS